jgi:hypothetical protein
VDRNARQDSARQSISSCDYALRANKAASSFIEYRTDPLDDGILAVGAKSRLTLSEVGHKLSRVDSARTPNQHILACSHCMTMMENHQPIAVELTIGTGAKTGYAQIVDHAATPVDDP